MGEFLDQILAGGPPVMGLEKVAKNVPSLFVDAEKMSDEDLRRVIVNLAGLRDRDIPAPHTRYGHVTMPIVGDESFPKDREGYLRTLACAIAGEWDAGGSKGIEDRSGVFAEHGMVNSQKTFNERYAVQREHLSKEMRGALVWQPKYPASVRGPSRIVVLTVNNRLTGGDLSTLGERTQVMWFDHESVDGGELCAPYARANWKYGTGDIVRARDAFVAAMDRAFGSHRAPILF